MVLNIFSNETSYQEERMLLRLKKGEAQGVPSTQVISFLNKDEEIGLIIAKFLLDLDNYDFFMLNEKGSDRTMEFYENLGAARNNRRNRICEWN